MASAYTLASSGGIASSLDKAIWEELAAGRALLARIADATERIAGAFEGQGVGPPAPVLCEHPPELRIEFGSMGGGEEWECATARGGCGFRFPRDIAAPEEPVVKE